MNQNDSLKWYQDHTAEFIARTADVDMTPHYSRFLEHVVPGGRILDLGCGAGKASLYFTQKGYQVLAVDGCQELCDFTHRRVGCPVRHMFFEELDYTDAFDAVWACASLLHVCKADLPDIFCETAGGFRITDMWLTRDARPDRQDESWVNMFCVAEKAE